MAKIPTGLFKTRASEDVPRTPTRSISSAGIVQKATFDALANVAKLGEDIALRRAKAEKDDFVSKNMIDFDLKMKDIEAQNKVKFSGQDINKLTDETKTSFEKELSNFSKQAPSSGASAAFAKQARSRMGARLNSLKGFEQVEKTKSYMRNIDRGYKNIAFDLFTSPDVEGGELALKAHMAAVSAHEGNLVSKEQMDEIRRQGAFTVASGQIHGLIRTGRHKEALDLVDRNYLGAFTNIQDTDKLIKQITGDNKNKTNDQIRLFTQTEKLRKIQYDKNQTQILQDIYLKAALGEDVKAEVLERIRNKEISPSKFSFIRREILNPQQREEDDKSLFDFTQRITSGEDLDQITQDVIGGTNIGQISTETGAKLLNMLDQRRKKSSVSAGEKRRFKIADEMLDGAFPVKNFLGKTNPLKRQELAEIKLEREDLIDKGASPVEATRAMINKFKDFSGMDLIPVVPSNLQADPILNDKPILRIIRDKLKRKEITKTQAVEFISLHKDRKTSFRFKDAKTVEELLREADDKSNR